MNLLRIIDNKITSIARQESYPYFAYALFQTISNPIYYLLWYYFDHHTYESFTARLIINTLCIPLLFHKYWPERLIRLLPYYWHLTILYSLPFFFTFMLLKNNFSYEWSLNSLSGFILCIIFIDAPSLLISLIFGVGIGIISYHLSTPQPFYPFDKIQPVLITYISIIIFGKLFIIRNSFIQHVKQKSLKMQARAIAHEMRTPLSAIEVTADGLQIYLPTLIENQKESQKKGTTTAIINPTNLELIAETPNDLKIISRSALTVIDMLLINLDSDLTQIPTKNLSISTCVQTALHEYPLSQEDRQLIAVTLDQDFTFIGNDTLIKHVLFNLLKNAIYYIKVAKKGSIKIWTEPGKLTNKLYVEDTGTGIYKKHLRHIFDQFFTKTAFGSGVGLAFCKMVMIKIGGDITCDSIKDEFTKFTLSFPAIPDSPQKK